MAMKEPLLPTQRLTERSKASLFYDADEYVELLEKRFKEDYEISELMAQFPDNDGKNIMKVNKGGAKETSKHAQRSEKTGRLFPTSNKPDPMPKDLAFMFTRISPQQSLYMWSFLTAMFFLQCGLIITYACLLYLFGNEYWWPLTFMFGIPFGYAAVQNIYVDHDVMHGATFPPYWWQKFITHPFSDFISIPWEEFLLEHMKHHSSTVDLLEQGEFGWDPEAPLYWLQQWSDKWYCLMFTVPLIPIVHFFGLNDTGGLFCLEWYMHFPAAEAGGKCNKEFWTKWFPRRIKHHLFVASIWVCVYLIGTAATGDGLVFMLTVSTCARCGYGAAWIFITNFTHSLPWNRFLEKDPARNWPRLHSVMALILGGHRRWNEMLFHDVHHAFPNAVGTLSMRGRFNDWRTVHQGALQILQGGLFKTPYDEERSTSMTS